MNIACRRAGVCDGMQESTRSAKLEEDIYAYTCLVIYSETYLAVTEVCRAALPLKTHPACSSTAEMACGEMASGLTSR